MRHSLTSFTGNVQLLNEWSISAQSGIRRCSRALRHHKSIPASTNIAKESIPTLKVKYLYNTQHFKSTYHCVFIIYLRIHVTTNLTRETRKPNNHILSNQMIVQMRTVYQTSASLRATARSQAALPFTTLLQAAFDTPTQNRVNVE